METRRLEAYVTLVDAGGFRLAAEALYITQPALSQQIARLEKDVGVRLIDRASRPIAMTEAGKEFYFRARKVLDAMQDISQLLDESRGVDFGRVRIGIVPAMLFSRPALAVRSFREKYPEAEVTLRTIGTAQLIEELEQGNVDAAILLTQPDLKDLSSLALFSEDYLVCLPSGHPLAGREEVRFEELRNETILQGPRVANPEGFDAVTAACMDAGFSPRTFTVVGSYLDHAGMVSAGMGVSFAPVSFADLLPHGVVSARLVGPLVGLTASVCWYDRRLDSVGRAFIDHFTEVFAESGASPASERKNGE